MIERIKPFILKFVHKAKRERERERERKDIPSNESTNKKNHLTQIKEK